MKWLFAKGSAYRKQFIQPVIQNSSSDAGLAALKAVLAGFDQDMLSSHIDTACQAEVDTTSLDGLENLAKQLGLDATQILLPEDHLLLSTAQNLPAIVPIYLAKGVTQLIVVWRLHGAWVQIMDPANGRHWVSSSSLSQQIVCTEQTLYQADWFQQASQTSFITPLKERLTTLCDDSSWVNQCVQIALEDDDWSVLAALDAATRMVSRLIQAGGLSVGVDAGNLVNKLLKKPELITAHYWQVSSSSKDKLTARSVRILYFSGLSEKVEKKQVVSAPSAGSSPPTRPELTPEKMLFQTLLMDGWAMPLLMLAGVLLAGLGVTLEVVLLRGLMEITQQFKLLSQQIEFYTLMGLFLLSLLVMEWPLSVAVMRFGRRLELRLREDFIKKIPRLEDQYFHHHLKSDMMQRAYELRQLRSLPPLAMNFLRVLSQILFVTMGLLILYPNGALLVLFSAFTVIALSLVTQPLLQEQDMQFRAHTSHLGRFYLDTLLGLIPIRSHNAESAMYNQHEFQMVHWIKSGQAFFMHYEVVSFFNVLISSSLAIVLVFSYLDSGGDTTGTLVLLFWMLQLPQLGRSLAEITQQYPALRNRLVRLLEPLSEPDEASNGYSHTVSKPDKLAVIATDKKASGVNIHFHQVTVELSGHPLLKNVDVTLNSAEHIAIVGKSGAGKSSLVGTLLGWHYPISGSVWVDGQLLQGAHLQALRNELAWVDTEVQLWNQSLKDNINYGNNESMGSLVETYQQTDLLALLEGLSEGERTVLGENGALLSGGEGQRVRLGRALHRHDVRLVILDEPFRGLTRTQRHVLLGRARAHWKHATLIFISHDIAESLDFDRVWVMDKGQLIEDDHPQLLKNKKESHYAQLLASDQEVQDLVWNSADWTRLTLVDGKLQVQE